MKWKTSRIYCRCKNVPATYLARPDPWDTNYVIIANTNRLKYGVKTFSFFIRMIIQQTAGCIITHNHSL